MTTQLHLETILQHMSEGFLAVDSAHIVRKANHAAGTILRTSAEGMVDRPLAAAIPDLSGSKAEAELAIIAEGTIAKRVQHFSPLHYTWLEILAVPQSPGLYLFVRNVTDRVRKQDTDAVREAVRAILRDAPVAISMTRGPEHRYDLMNEMARQLIGGRDLEGRTMRNAFPELADSPIVKIMDEVYRTGEAYVGRNVRVAFDRKGDGQLVEGAFDFTYQPLFEPDGKVWGILSVAVETSDGEGNSLEQ